MYLQDASPTDQRSSESRISHQQPLSLSGSLHTHSPANIRSGYGEEPTLLIPSVPSFVCATVASHRSLWHTLHNLHFAHLKAKVKLQPIYFFPYFFSSCKTQKGKRPQAEHLLRSSRSLNWVRLWLSWWYDTTHGHHLAGNGKQTAVAS